MQIFNTKGNFSTQGTAFFSLDKLFQPRKNTYHPNVTTETLKTHEFHNFNFAIQSKKIYHACFF
jgi:hypothetical protein